MLKKIVNNSLNIVQNSTGNKRIELMTFQLTAGRSTNWANYPIINTVWNRYLLKQK